MQPCFKLALYLLCLAQSATCLCQQTCPGEFEALSASEYVAAIGPGWNLGNTLDAFPDEGSWNNPPVLEKTFDDVKAVGFKSVRIPGTSRFNLYLLGDRISNTFKLTLLSLSSDLDEPLYRYIRPRRLP